MQQAGSTVVIDNGSSTVKAGFSGEDAPRVEFRNVVGRGRHAGVFKSATQAPVWLGEEAWQKRGMLLLKPPVEDGIVTNWDDMEKIWMDTFYTQLDVSPEDQPVLLTEAPHNPPANRERTAELMFETFSTPALSIELAAVLSLASTARKTGVVVDAGEGLTHTVPVYEGRAVRQAATQLNIGGRHLTDHLSKLLSRYQFNTPSERLILREIKERVCSVAPSAAQAADYHREKTYELPDGLVISVESELVMCPEALFQPLLLQVREGAKPTASTDPVVGIHECVYNSIMKVPYVW
jgi:actin beta/gamma 1